MNCPAPNALGFDFVAHLSDTSVARVTFEVLGSQLRAEQAAIARLRLPGALPPNFGGIQATRAVGIRVCARPPGGGPFCAETTTSKTDSRATAACRRIRWVRSVQLDKGAYHNVTTNKPGRRNVVLRPRPRCVLGSLFASGETRFHRFWRKPAEQICLMHLWNCRAIAAGSRAALFLACARTTGNGCARGPEAQQLATLHGLAQCPAVPGGHRRGTALFLCRAGLCFLNLAVVGST